MLQQEAAKELFNKKLLVLQQEAAEELFNKKLLALLQTAPTEKIQLGQAGQKCQNDHHQ